MVTTLTDLSPSSRTYLQLWSTALPGPTRAHAEHSIQEYLDPNPRLRHRVASAGTAMSPRATISHVRACLLRWLIRFMLLRNPWLLFRSRPIAE